MGVSTLNGMPPTVDMGIPGAVTSVANDPNRKRVLFQNLICQHIRKYRCQDRCKLRPHIVEFQQIIRRPSKRLVYDRFRPDGGPEKARRNVRHGLCAVGIGSFACHGGRGPDADWRLVRRAAIAKATNEDSDIGALATASRSMSRVSMRQRMTSPLIADWPR